MPHNQQTPNHVVHALVSLFLIGLWIPVWILIALGSGNEPAACVKCGNRRLPTGAAVVGPSAAEAKANAKADLRKLLIVVLACAAVGGALYLASLFLDF